MAVITGSIIAALVAALAAAGAGAGAASYNSSHNNKTWDSNRKLPENLNSEDLDNLLNYYKKNEGQFNFFNPNSWFQDYSSDYDAMDRDYQQYLKLKDSIGDMPVAPDYDAIERQAGQAIDRENNEILALYDSMRNNNSDFYGNEMDSLNRMYNDYSSQILSNNAQSQNMIQSSVRSELDRSQRNAITRGASAAQRLVANINTQLGLQNKAAQQSLETSNVLAQQLVNQRQAASNLRQSYMSSQNADLNNRAQLMRGTAERKNAYANNMFNTAEAKYENASANWEDRNSNLAKPFADMNRQRSINNNYGI
jgi:hypothetical protein